MNVDIEYKINFLLREASEVGESDTDRSEAVVVNEVESEVEMEEPLEGKIFECVQDTGLSMAYQEGRETMMINFGQTFSDSIHEDI